MLASHVVRWAAPIYLLLCLAAGGASGDQAGAVANGVIQFFGLLAIVITLRDRDVRALLGKAKALLCIVLGFVAIVGLSLIPLPPALWTHIPGRSEVVEGYKLLGQDLPWLPLSLDKERTATSILWLIPPSAMFLLAARLDRDRRRKLLQVTLGFAFASLLLGGMQLAGGTASGLRPYTVTNSDYPVGFFANVNHFATLLLCSIIFLGYVAAGFVTAARSRGQRNAAIAFGATAVTLLLVGLATTGSMAGLMLVFPALFAAYVVYRRRVERRVLSWLYPAVFIAFTLSIVALGLAGTIPSQALAGEVGASRLSRTTIAAKTIEAIEQHFPVGSGLGTFADVYRPLEDRNGLDREYMNHAHNDYLEWALELGIAGVLLTALFLFWWSSRVLQLWRTTADGVPLALAAGAAIGIILLHSLVEYPMRTSAIAVIFGMACAMLVPHSSRTSPGREPKKDLPSDRPRHMVAD